MPEPKPKSMAAILREMLRVSRRRATVLVSFGADGTRTILMVVWGVLGWKLYHFDDRSKEVVGVSFVKTNHVRPHETSDTVEVKVAASTTVFERLESDSQLVSCILSAVAAFRTSRLCSFLKNSKTRSQVYPAPPKRTLHHPSVPW